jgi:hypothetical protein
VVGCPDEFGQLVGDLGLRVDVSNVI